MYLIRTDSSDADFRHLVSFLDKELAERDGNEHAFYAQFNKIATLKNCVVLYEGDKAVGCGAFKPFSDDAVEVKRMFVPPELRGKGIAKMILDELEKWAKEVGYAKCVLETGKRQPEAIALYTKAGYKLIPNYGQYAGKENSVCFEKVLE